MMNSLLEVRQEGEKRQGSDSSAIATNNSTGLTSATEEATESTGVPASTATIDHNMRPLPPPPGPLATTVQQPPVSFDEGPLAGAKKNALRPQMVVDEHSGPPIGFASIDVATSVQHYIASAQGIDTNALISVTVNGNESYETAGNAATSQMMQSI